MSRSLSFTCTSKLPLILQWRSITPEEKAKYEKLAAEDKERYNKECAVSILDGQMYLQMTFRLPRWEKLFI